MKLDYMRLWHVRKQANLPQNINFNLENLCCHPIRNAESFLNSLQLYFPFLCLFGETNWLLS